MTGTGAKVAASVVPGIFALGAVFLAIHFAKKRGFLAFNDRNSKSILIEIVSGMIWSHALELRDTFGFIRAL